MNKRATFGFDPKPYGIYQHGNIDFDLQGKYHLAMTSSLLLNMAHSVTNKKHGDFNSYVKIPESDYGKTLANTMDHTASSKLT